ncbi:hypothetical protein [Thalassobacter stenotrophicus]|uniref:Uncharacterized protein n=2 Tax=Thalassobacter stenotrophicus TaxID=266809 RepID=A0A0P1EYH6_9RHOB|nr:hypothetical protein [Thalassobacter stenotrophicus]CUH60245.1 hypothetical protein THS5294_01534 [Thalassobacter stenotrophicus]SHI71122.1 hypothetical protein SAMN02744035_01326 [Thalassobacter stenotrophicus DSM 16310]
MTLLLSATCLAIALADERGAIEIADNLEAAQKRVNDLRMRAAA